MSLMHRAPALLAAFLSSTAVLLAAFAGTSCEFIHMRVKDDTFFLIAPEGPEGFAVLDEQMASIGVLCNEGFYDREGDKMWELSRFFLILGLLFGSLTAALAWAICSYMSPSIRKWKSISFLAAIAAVVQVPVFVLMEAEPCTDFRSNQTCSLGSGSFVLVASVIFYISVCICTQCLDPPQWAMELDLWKANKRGISRKASKFDGGEEGSFSSEDDHVHLTAGDHNQDEDICHISRILPASKVFQDKKFSPREAGIGATKFFSWFNINNRYSQDDLEVPQIETEPTKDHEEDEYGDDDDDEENQYHNVGEYDFRHIDDSHMILRVLSDKEAPQADSKHLTSVTANEKSSGPSGEKIGDHVSSNAILEDLEQKETSIPRSDDDSDLDGEENKPACVSSDMLMGGIRKLTKKLKRDSNRRKSRRQWRTGYSQMAEDNEEYDTDEEAVSVDSPPLEVQLPVLEKSMDSTANDQLSPEKGIQFQMPDLNDGDDDEDIYLDNENWMNLTTGSSFEIQKAKEDFEEDEQHPFASNVSFGSGQIEPEPKLCDSDSDEASIDQHDDSKSKDEIMSLGNDLSSEVFAHAQSEDASNSRGRRETRDILRKRRTTSPVESIKSSCSLLHITINEETEEDIKNELETAYSLSRTKSAPETGSRGHHGVVMEKCRVDLVKTLDIQVEPYDEAKYQKEDLDSAEVPVIPVLDLGDIPMLPKTTIVYNKLAAEEDQPMDESIHGTGLDIAGGIDQAEQSAKATATPSVMHTWTEPDLPSKKTRKRPTIGGGGKKSSSEWKLSTVLSLKDQAKNRNSEPANILDDASDTDDTGCLSRTTDSFSDDSDVETNPKRIVVRSRSLDRSSFRSKPSTHSKSLSPSRSRRPSRSFAASGRARDIRIRRIQKLKGYVPLQETSRVSSPSDEAETPSEAQTPKRKTRNLSPGERKEDDAFIVTGDFQDDFPDDLFQPNLACDIPLVTPSKSVGSDYSEEEVGYHDGPQESPEFDSMLEELDLQLIDLRRPVGAEYGDEEGSL